MSLFQSKGRARVIFIKQEIQRKSRRWIGFCGFLELGLVGWGVPSSLLTLLLLTLPSRFDI